MPPTTPVSTGNPMFNFFSSMFAPALFSLYIPPFQVPFELKINPRNSLHSVITQLLKDITSKTNYNPNRHYQHPSANDWVLIDITKGSDNKLIHGSLAKDYIQDGATYLVLSARGAVEFGNKAGSQGKRIKQEEVLKWLEAIAPGTTMWGTPEGSDDGTFSVA
ncbi:hypothetical protein FPQ18DRAFT_379746 [Pyronema domesticum]|nr:hypothetical protein FPQ18DRAFT_379746 [Pyronema domesticum]